MPRPRTPDMPAESPFNIAIIGAGIGGLALAIGLTHLNVPFTLYEAAPAFSAVGAGIGLGPNALQAMDLIDKRFRDMYLRIATGNLDPEKKHVMMEVMRMEQGLGQGEDWWGHASWGADYFERTGAHRKDLLEIMAGFIPSDAIRFNKRVAHITQGQNEVTVTFHDGQVVRHAALIGSDGIKGLTRHVVLHDRYPDLVKPQYTGKYVYRTIIPMPDAKEILGPLATDAKMFMSKGANLSTYPISNGQALNMGAFKHDPMPWMSPEGTQQVTRAEMLNDFAENHPDQRLLQLLRWTQPVRWAIFHHPDTPTYYNSLVCLIGDVAHASGPHQAAAAGQCLEDALILSRVLGRLYHNSCARRLLFTADPRRTKLIEAAFGAYDEIRRPRAQEQVRTSQDCGEIYNFMHPRFNDDIMALVHELNGRFAWLWQHDLSRDIQRAITCFDNLAKVVIDPPKDI